MYYKKQKIGKKWYPRSFTAGTYDTKDVAGRRTTKFGSVPSSPRRWKGR